MAPGLSWPCSFDLPAWFHGILGLTCPPTSYQDERPFWWGFLLFLSLPKGFSLAPGDSASFRFTRIVFTQAD